jgi:hypothetical protein
MQADVKYSVLAKGNHRKEEKKRVNNEVNILKCAQNFCVTLVHIPNQDIFCLPLKMFCLPPDPEVSKTRR